MSKKRIVITGMSINTPLGDTLEDFYQSLIAGKSAITKWKSIDTTSIYGKVGGDLGDYDTNAKLAKLQSLLPDSIYQRLRLLYRKMPWSSKLSLLIAADAWVDSGLSTTLSPHDMNLIVAGHNLNQGYIFSNYQRFSEEPDYIDGLLSVYSLDTHHVGCVTECLGIKGSSYTVGGACSSGNFALRSAIDEIRHHNSKVGFVLGPVLDFSPIEVQGMSLMGAITYQSFNEQPEAASRPFDTRREGFVPSHGAACLVIEDLDHALARGARIYAEVLGAASCSDACHLPQPSVDGQTYLMNSLLSECGLAPEAIDYISAHATSTQLGDITELTSIKNVFGRHTNHLKINAPKSMLGHTCWSSALVESVACIMQMKGGILHPSINIDTLDPQVDVDVCRGHAVKFNPQITLNNSFGFGGMNGTAIFKQYGSSK